jgi:hypothetical protein
MIRQTDHHRTVTSVALTTPAVRLVVVEAWAEKSGAEWQAEHEIIPVIALQVTAGHDYTRRFDEHDRPPRISADHAEMIRLGWRYNSTQMVEYDAVVLDREYGVCEASFACEAENCSHEIVACPWPAEEDAERLKDAIERIKEQAIRNARLRGRKAETAAQSTARLP